MGTDRRAASRPAPGGGTETGGLLGETPAAGLVQIFRRFWPGVRPYRRRLWVTVALVAVGPALDTAGIWMFKILIDDVLTPQHFGLFPLVAGVYVALTLVAGVVSFTDDYLSTWVSEQFLLDLRTRLFAHVQRLSVGFFERHPLGDVLSRLTGDIATIEQTVISGLVSALSYAFTIMLYGAALFYLNWQLALASLVAAPLFWLAARSFSARIKTASRGKRRRTGAITAAAEESFANAALVQVYDREASETDRFHRENLGSFRAQMDATRLRALFSPLIDLLEAGGAMLVLALGMWELAQNRITLGGLLVFVVYLTQLYSPIRGFARLSNSVYAATASAERIMELQDLQPLVREPAAPRPLGRARGVVRVEGLSFTYPGTTQATLQDIELTVAEGQRVAVVGASGAGKSTLVKLMLRLYDPDAGRVLLDGCDLRELALADLRRNMAVVLQETLVFDGTIRDNILWGKPDANEAEMLRASVAADADAFVRMLPDDYATRVGQRGRMLSGGQRQRVAIARAMIRDAPVLLLDEPTTGLDAESADRILTPLRRLMAGRTTVVISHNLLTVIDADRILYLEHGRITGSGTHQELLVTHPGYAHLHRLHRQGPPAAEPVVSGPSRPSPVRRVPLPSASSDGARSRS